MLWAPADVPGKRLREWNTQPDGEGRAYQPGERFYIPHPSDPGYPFTPGVVKTLNYSFYAIWDSASATTPPETYFYRVLLGDVNFDEKVDIKDLLALVDHIFELESLTGDAFIAGDIAENELIDVEDLLALIDVIFEVWPGPFERIVWVGVPEPTPTATAITTPLPTPDTTAATPRSSSSPTPSPTVTPTPTQTPRRTLSPAEMALLGYDPESTRITVIADGVSHLPGDFYFYSFSGYPSPVTTPPGLPYDELPTTVYIEGPFLRGDVGIGKGDLVLPSITAPSGAITVVCEEPFHQINISINEKVWPFLVKLDENNSFQRNFEPGTHLISLGYNKWGKHEDTYGWYFIICHFYVLVPDADGFIPPYAPYPH